ncbi:MAG: MFS transporter, partial [Proteobacteria bacterium]|nr:MFS transporter [Pseudomonadota bacterium]
SLNRVIIRDAFAGVQLIKALSYIGAFIALAPAIAPAFGGFIETHWGWRWIFGFLLIYSSVLTILAWFTLPETHMERAKNPLSLKQVMINYSVIIKNQQFWANVCCSGLAFAAMIACATINPFLLENVLGKSAAAYGFWAMISAVGFFIGMMSNSHIVTRIGTEKTLKLGNVIILAMAIVFIIAGSLKIVNLGVIIIPTIGVELGIALVFPNAFVGAITPFAAMTGTAGALYGCLQIAITFITSIVVAMLNGNSSFPMGLLLAVTAILGIGIYQLLKQAHWETVSTPSLTAE